MRSIDEVGLGDYVRGLDRKLYKIASTWGVTDRPGSTYKSLAKPSEGGFGVITEGGLRIGMFEAREYLKKEDVEFGE